MRCGLAVLCLGLAATIVFWAVACDSAGPGAGGDGAAGANFQVTDDLRAACPGESDGSIQRGMNAADGDRNAGMSQQEALAQVDEDCVTSDYANCRACGSTVVNEVYAQASGTGGDTSGGGGGGGDSSDGWDTDGWDTGGWDTGGWDTGGSDTGGWGTDG